MVHIKQGRDKDTTRRWDAGGPLLPSLQTALANYPHQLVELEVSSCVLQLCAGGVATAGFKGWRRSPAGMHSLPACTLLGAGQLCWVQRDNEWACFLDIISLCAKHEASGAKSRSYVLQPLQ